MKWGGYWPEFSILLVVVTINGFRWLTATGATNPPLGSSGWSVERKLAVREKIRELWYHGFDNYMTFAFPLDELTPLSCSGQGPDWANPANIALNDVTGNFSLTLIDVLDTLVVLDDRAGFEKALKNVIDWVSFDVDTKPQVFETTIRVLGGLLSGHIFASKPGQPFHQPWYRGELLSLAHDLGERMLPAFKTPTGLPYARVNLRRGVMQGESVETCVAGAGSLILEFGTLSRLTGDDRFEKAAHKAFFGLWNRKSDIGLVGNTINVKTGQWINTETTGIGAGIDSFYEYALKWYILSGDIEFLDVWDDAYATIMRYVREKDGYWHRTVNMKSGDTAYLTVDSLSAFWPGLQVLAGDVQSAIKLHMVYYNLWKQHSGLPEVYDTGVKTATSHQYPLRPEFIESTWYLYRATRDTFYLDVGERVLFDLITRAKVSCGLTGISDLRNNKRDDRMESFALSETIKYLYLLFDEENPLHSNDSNYVFTTEAHILSLDPQHTLTPPILKKRTRNVEDHQCPMYRPFLHAQDPGRPDSGLVQGIRSRPDVEYARFLVGLSPSSTDAWFWSPDGWCEQPKVEPYSYEFILSAGGRTVAEDLSPSFVKLEPKAEGFILHNVTGIRTQIVQRLDGRGYDVRKLGHYAVRPGQIVYVNDSTIFQTPGDAGISQDEFRRRDLQLQLRIYTPSLDSGTQNGQSGLSKAVIDVSIVGYTASFGADLSSIHNPSDTDFTPQIARSSGVAVEREANNMDGCTPYKFSHPYSVLIVRRGTCTFLQKLTMSREASAAGIIVISDEDIGINPTADSLELATAGNLSDSGIILLPKKTGDLLEQLIIANEQAKGPQIMMAVQPKAASGPDPQLPTAPAAEDQKEEAQDPNRILYINGHALINTRLLV